MKATQVSDNIIQLKRAKFVSGYLVREDDGFTLIDTCLPGSAAGLIAGARAAGGEIRRIALTHGHGDHVGSLDALREKLGNEVTVLMGELDARIHGGEKVIEGKLPGSWPKIKTTPDVRLKDGDTVGSLTVVASPGHSPGHVSFFDPRDRTLIAGDAFTAVGGVAIPAHFFLRFPLAAMATWDKAKAVESARALRALEPAVLVCGHGPVVRENPGAAIEQAIARAERAGVTSKSAPAAS